jgi:hypothetical protein
MKKLIVLFMLLLPGVNVIAGKPPAAVTKAFEKKFPNAKDVKWTKDSPTEWEASFVIEQLEVSAIFSNAGKWLETETELPVAQLPENVSQAILKSYKGYTITEAYKIESTKPGLVYEAELKKGLKSKEVLYKEDGKPYKKPK